jgi:hypothetical protein
MNLPGQPGMDRRIRAAKFPAPGALPPITLPGSLTCPPGFNCPFSSCASGFHAYSVGEFFALRSPELKACCLLLLVVKQALGEKCNCL